MATFRLRQRADSQTEPAQDTVTGREGSETPLPPSLQGIAEKAHSQKRYRFRNLYGRLTEERRKESGRESKTHAAYGVDQISAQDSEPHREGNIRDLIERL